MSIGEFHPGKKQFRAYIFGKASYIWVNEENRCKGITSLILKTVVDELNLSKVSFSLPNNASRIF